MAGEYTGDSRRILVGVEEVDATTGDVTLNYVAFENETSASLSGENEEIEINSKGDLHAKSLAGIASDSLSLEAYAHEDLTIAQAQNRLLQARRNRELVYFQYAARDIATGAITPLEENYGRITSVEQEAGMDEAVTLSIEATLQDFWTPVAA